MNECDIQYEEPVMRTCEWQECGEEGLCPAPKEKPRANDSDSFAGGGGGPFMVPERYHWFCQRHAREYNRQWNYFAEMPPEQIEQFQEDAVIGHRPTWRMGLGPEFLQSQVQEKLYDMFGESVIAKPEHPMEPTLPKAVRDGLAVLNLECPVTLQEVKVRYKALVKQYHPDVNDGDAEAEERFKAVGVAYADVREWLEGL